jgi:hypothetical protein
LWQLEQVPGVTPVWSKRAGRQAVVVWQFSQMSSLVMWDGVLPVACTPSWQVAQLLVMAA